MNRTYNLGVLFFILSVIVSLSNDIIQKFLGSSVDIYVIIFLRNLFATLSLLPVVIYNNNYIRSQNIGLHIVRGILLFFAMTLWVLGLSKSHISIATIFSSTIPFFNLVLSYYFLKEKFKIRIWIATLIGFIGVVVLSNPLNKNISYTAIFFIFSALCFSCLDIINKKSIKKESTISMLFFSDLFTSLFAFYPAYCHWTTPDTYEITLLFILGVNANLILYLILKSFSYVNVSDVAPYRYLEFIFSLIMGFLIFREIPNFATIIGSLIIIPASCFINYYENSKSSLTE